MPPQTGYWVAADGRWYPPHLHPNSQPPKAASELWLERHDPNVWKRRGIATYFAGITFLVGAMTLPWDNESLNGGPWFSVSGFHVLGWCAPLVLSSLIAVGIGVLRIRRRRSGIAVLSTSAWILPALFTPWMFAVAWDYGFNLVDESLNRSTFGAGLLALPPATLVIAIGGFIAWMPFQRQWDSEQHLKRLPVHVPDHAG